MTNIQLFQEIAELPDDLKKRVEEFVAHIKKEKKLSFKKRTFGYSPGFFTMKDNFDDPIKDFEKYM